MNTPIKYNATDHFKKAIEEQLTLMAQSDELFAESLKKPTKVATTQNTLFFRFGDIARTPGHDQEVSRSQRKQPCHGNTLGYRQSRWEFLHVHDLAKAVHFVMEYPEPLPDDLINAGTGEDLTIKELAETIQKIVGHRGTIDCDTTKPDGTPRKLMDTSRLNNLGWQAVISLERGVEETYRWYGSM